MHPSLNSQMIPGDFAAVDYDVDGILANQGIYHTFGAIMTKQSKLNNLRLWSSKHRLSSIVEAQDVIATMIITSTRPNGGELSDFYHNYLVNLGWNGV